MASRTYIVEPDPDRLKACFNHFAALGLTEVLLLPWKEANPVLKSFHFKTSADNGEIIPPSEELMRRIYPSWEFQPETLRVDPAKAWIQLDIEDVAHLISLGLWRREQYTDENHSDQGGRYLPINVQEAIAVLGAPRP